MNAYDFTVKDMNGEDVALSSFQGKVLLIVNTATGCGFTPQYTELQEMYEEFKDQGFEILDFPCNQFGEQTPGSDEEVHDFCTGRYGITCGRRGTSCSDQLAKAVRAAVIASNDPNYVSPLEDDDDD